VRSAEVYTAGTIFWLLHLHSNTLKQVISPKLYSLLQYSLATQDMQRQC